MSIIIEEVIETDYTRDGNCGAWEDFTLIFKVYDKHIAVDTTRWYNNTVKSWEEKFIKDLELAYFVEPYQELVTYYRSI